MHVKLGHFNSLIWVADFATGEPVADANVSIYKDAVSLLSADKQVLSKGKKDQDGIVLLEGTEKLDSELKTFSWRCRKDSCERLFIKVEEKDQMALIPLDRYFEVNTYRASSYSSYSSQKKAFGHIYARGTTAQGVYRAGDIMQFKLYVRNQDNQTFIPPPRQGYQLEIIDPSGKSVHKNDKIELSEFGGFNGEYTIPKPL